MAFPAIAAIPLVGKALTALKGGKMLAAGANAAKYAAGVPGATKQLALNLGGGKARMAGAALKKAATEKANIKYLKDNYGVDVGGSVKDFMNRGLNMSDDAGLLDRVKRGTTSIEGFKNNLGIPMTRNDIAMSVAPDLLFGGFAAATTEGDLADKAIAGLGSSVGGIAGGLGARGLLGPKSGLGILGTEMVGGIIGDQVGYGAANSIIRAKHGGMTPTEKLMAEQDEQYRSQIVDEFLAQNGMG